MTRLVTAQVLLVARQTFKKKSLGREGDYVGAPDGKKMVIGTGTTCDTTSAKAVRAAAAMAVALGEIFGLPAAARGGQHGGEFRSGTGGSGERSGGC